MPPLGSDPVIEVAAGLVFHQGRVLIAQRPPGKHLAGLWEFPGGKREPGESWEECLRRELREELGIEVSVGDLVAETRHTYPGRTVWLRFLAAAWLGGEPRAVGCSAFAWADVAELARYEFPPADTEVLARVRERPEMKFCAISL